ncbi:MAG TPA: hypothetical protein VHE55_12845 [Fimbriimonadaceae bacterium]|nr:hypothetical protein [Fimbriimonadaceae bacterium]
MKRLAASLSEWYEEFRTMRFNWIVETIVALALLVILLSCEARRGAPAPFWFWS